MLERHRGQLDEWLLLNHWIRENDHQLTVVGVDGASRKHTYLVQARGVEAILAGLTRLVRKIPIHRTDKPTNTNRELP